MAGREPAGTETETMTTKGGYASEAEQYQQYDPWVYDSDGNYVGTD